MAEEREDMKQKLSELHCPFTWDMTKFELSNWDKYELKYPTYHEIFDPQSQFIKHLIVAYKQILKQEFNEAKESIGEIEKLIDHFKDLKKDVMEHIFLSTKVHFLMKKEDFDEANNILFNIQSIEDKIYLSIINEIKAALWTHCNDFTHTAKIAITFAELSLKYDPNNATSHYLLAKNLRGLRRLISCHTSSNEEEILHFKRAYELEKNPKFAIFLGQAYKEKNLKDKADIIFQEIHSMNIQSRKINLRLSLYFLKNNFLDKAEKCLTFVEAGDSKSSWFLHYKGLYLMKKNKYEEAAECFKEAYDQNNYGADLGYAKCMRILRKRFDFIDFFLNLIKKYHHDTDKFKEKEIYLHIAFTFFDIKRDIREAIKYFYQAFQVKSPEFKMERYRNPLTDKNVNVYNFLSNHVFPKIENYIKNKTIYLPEEVLVANERLKKICDEHFSH
ncbi:uncharacterized protein LOC127285901 [Leptopilina boulardi]|uniref:uncharacterized protein LOC127285901 n=1 Tax=Leptopilina boulardi TaxID=63433 RepID=UPI0021F552AD|nr:uncharacterized protein LOC127285901 [Leptopilina boulardi]